MKFGCGDADLMASGLFALSKSSQSYDGSLNFRLCLQVPGKAFLIALLIFQSTKRAVAHIDLSSR